MVGVEQEFCLLTKGLAQEFSIETLYIWVIMGLTERTLFVQTIQLFATTASQLLTVMNRLTAAANAAAGTGHNLYEVIMYLAGTNILHKITGVA